MPASLDPVLLAAAKGDARAQEALLDRAVATVRDCTNVSAEMITTMEWWARVLAAHGFPADAVRLAGILLYRSAIERSVGLTATARDTAEECFNILQTLAAQGNSGANERLSEWSAIVAAEVGVVAAVSLGAKSVANC